MSLSLIAKKLGRRGGLKRAERLSSAQKKQIASRGGWARAESLQLAKRVEENFRYLKAIQEMVPPPKIHSSKSFRNKLPGIYA